MLDKLTTTDGANIAQVVSSVLTPLAQQQATVQQSAIQADLEKHRLSIELHGKSAQRSFLLALTLLVITSGAIAGLMIAGRYELAVNVLYFGLGAVGGFGLGRARFTQ